MEKEKIISKLNIKDYNNQLEKILAKKTFSEETKNVLLNMLYNIENAYDDYCLVNGETKTKKETLEEILNIISNDCNTIEIVKNKESTAITEEKKIITYLNTRKMLYEIYQLSNRKFEVSDEYEIIKPSLEKTLKHGYSIASNEVIRDFDGWSWNIAEEEIEDKISNLIYQTLKILVGYNFLEEWLNSSRQDYTTKLINILNNEYKAELAEKIFKVINQIAMLNVAKENQDEKNRLIQKQKDLQEEFDKLDNKKEYLTTLGEKKKKIVKDIKKIDSIINNDKELKNEFIARNELLDMNNRIFSLSDFVEALENEREELIKKLDRYSKQMEPLNYIKTKTEIENKLILIKEIDLQKEDKNILNSKIKELINLTIKAMKTQVDKIEEKEKITKLIYKIRYYGLIYVDNEKQIKDIVDINNIQKAIITKACKQKIITIFSKNIKENYEIVKNILQTDIIELENIYFKFLPKTEHILLEIYDEENIYKTIEFDKIEELNVKLNKKIKVFI